MVLIAHQPLQVERRGVVEELPRLAKEEGLSVQPSLLPDFPFLQHGGLGWLEDAVEATQDCEREDDLAVLGLLVVAAQQLSDGPDE